MRCAAATRVVIATALAALVFAPGAASGASCTVGPYVSPTPAGYDFIIAFQTDEAGTVTLSFDHDARLVASAPLIPDSEEPATTFTLALPAGDSKYGFRLVDRTVSRVTARHTGAGCSGSTAIRLGLPETATDPARIDLGPPQAPLPWVLLAGVAGAIAWRRRTSHR